MNKTSNENVNYIIESAELVGIEITENTPIDMAFVAELVKRVYDKGYSDGMKAQAFHEEICREEGKL